MGMRVRNSNGIRSPPATLSPTSSPTKKDMVQMAEQRAMEWAAGQSPTSRSGQRSQRWSPKSPSSSTLGSLLGAGSHSTGTDLPAATQNAPSAQKATSSVERQLDDILNELDEIDRIHADVCMLSHA